MQSNFLYRIFLYRQGVDMTITAKEAEDCLEMTIRAEWNRPRLYLDLCFIQLVMTTDLPLLLNPSLGLDFGLLDPLVINPVALT